MTAEDISELPLEADSDPLSEAPLRSFVRSQCFTPESLTYAELRSPRRHIASLLARGLSIDARDHAGETPLFKLMTATFDDPYNSSTHKTTLLPALKLLEDAGANFTVRNNIGESVLHKLATQMTRNEPRGFRKAVENPNEDFQKSFRWLVEKGIDVGWEDEASQTCLDVAAAAGAQWVLDMYKRK